MIYLKEKLSSKQPVILLFMITSFEHNFHNWQSHSALGKIQKNVSLFFFLWTRCICSKLWNDLLKRLIWKHFLQANKRQQLLKSSCLKSRSVLWFAWTKGEFYCVCFFFVIMVFCKSYFLEAKTYILKHLPFYICEIST